MDVATEHEGLAVRFVPGGTLFTRVYVPVGGRVYSINVYVEDPNDEGLGAADGELLSNLRFEPPAQEADGPAGLPAANSAQGIHPSGDELRTITALDEVKGPSLPSSRPLRLDDKRTRGGERRRRGADRRGCWRADPRYYIQTQHGLGANRCPEVDAPTEWTKIGVPNSWGQYTHENLSYGRCTEPDWANDKYAVDRPPDRGTTSSRPSPVGR